MVAWVRIYMRIWEYSYLTRVRINPASFCFTKVSSFPFAVSSVGRLGQPTRNASRDCLVNRSVPRTDTNWPRALSTSVRSARVASVYARWRADNRFCLVSPHAALLALNHSAISCYMRGVWVYGRTRVSVCVCVCVVYGAGVYTQTHVSIHPSTHTSMHLYTHRGQARASTAEQRVTMAAVCRLLVPYSTPTPTHPNSTPTPTQP